MSPTLAAILLLAIYFVYVGWSRRKEVASRVAEPKGEKRRHPGFFATIAGIFTVVGAGEYALAIDLTPEYGFAGPSLFLGLAIALVFVSFVAPKVRGILGTQTGAASTYDDYLSFTTPDVFFLRCGQWASRVSTGITSLAFLGILWLQLILGGRLIANIAAIPYPAAVLLLALVVAFYVTLGRFAAIYHTDVYQGALMWLTLYVAVIFLFFARPEANRPYTE